MTKRTLVLWLAGFFLLTGCTENQKSVEVPKPSPNQIEFAEAALPSDEALKDIYARSCQSCHSVYGMNAPLTGHKAGWAPRFEEKGIDGLVASTKSGIRAMPAMGLCRDCSDADFEALINFMAGESN